MPFELNVQDITLAAANVYLHLNLETLFWHALAILSFASHFGTNAIIGKVP